MGQYHHPVNLDKREALDPHGFPHGFGHGMKLWEQAQAGRGGIGAALVVLLAVSNGRGGGDFTAPDPHGVVGRWGGDRIAIVGDYAKAGDLPPEFEAEKIYSLVDVPDGYADITQIVREFLVAEGILSA